jgi:hypothetical protein
VTLSLYPHRLASRMTPRATSQKVVDCAAYALRNADDASRSYLQLNSDFVHDYRAQLDEAALRLDKDGTSMFGRMLTEVWAEHGYTVELADETDGEPFRYDMPRCPADDVFYAVWDEAVYRLDPDEVVRAARLDDELTTTYAD